MQKNKGKHAAAKKSSAGKQAPTMVRPDEPLPVLDLRTALLTLPDDYYAGGDVPEFQLRGVAVRDVGRDARGKTIPHRRSETVARRVSMWVACGASKIDVAVRLNIRPGLVELCYGRELEFGGGQTAIDVSEHILKRVKSSDQVAMFFAKTRLKWREVDPVGTVSPEDTARQVREALAAMEDVTTAKE